MLISRTRRKIIVYNLVENSNYYPQTKTKKVEKVYLFVFLLVYNGCMVLEKEKIYKLDELKKLYFDSHKGKSKIAFYKAINKMINNDEIIRLERGFYCVNQKKNIWNVSFYGKDRV